MMGTTRMYVHEPGQIHKGSNEELVRRNLQNLKPQDKSPSLPMGLIMDCLSLSLYSRERERLYIPVERQS
jgi:hypothetical protein